MSENLEYEALAARHVSLRRVAKLFVPYKKRLALVVGLITIAAASGALSPFLIRAIVDDALPSLDMWLLFILVGGIIGVAALSALMDMSQVFVTTSVGQSIMHDLRVQLYGHLQSLSLRFFAKTRTGEIQSRVASDIGGLQSLVTNTIADLAKNASVVLATVAAMVLLDWRLAFLTFLTMPLVIWLNVRIAERRERVSYGLQKRMADMSAGVQETLSVSGIMLSRTMGRTRFLTNRFARTSKDVSSLEIRAHTVGQGEWAVIYFGLAIFPAITFLAGGLLMANNMSLTIGTLVAMIALQEQLLWPLLELLQANVEIRKARSLFARVFEYLDAEVDITERPDPVKIARSQMRGAVRLEDVSFSYDENKPALHDINIDIPAGHSVAIVGATGSGKSTLGYLLARLYDVDRGSISYDGVDVRAMSFDTLAEMLGVVTQDIYILHGTVSENLRFARPDATDDEIEQAARIAGIHEHLSALPLGYGTMLGERGHRFSGGEKQRLAIARTILRDPPVLLLDEATSALDNQTEQDVVNSIEQLPGQRTVITIAHRLSTIKRADQVVVLSAGRVVQKGRYKDLLDQNGPFSDLVRSSQSNGLDR